MYIRLILRRTHLLIEARWAYHTIGFCVAPGPRQRWWGGLQGYIVNNARVAEMELALDRKWGAL